MEDPEAVASRRWTAAAETASCEVPHPWAAIVARYGRPGRQPAPLEVHVLRWRTSRGEQPVLLVVRRRRD